MGIFLSFLSKTTSINDTHPIPPHASAHTGTRHSNPPWRSIEGGPSRAFLPTEPRGGPPRRVAAALQPAHRSDRIKFSSPFSRTHAQGPLPFLASHPPQAAAAALVAAAVAAAKLSLACAPCQAG